MAKSSGTGFILVGLIGGLAAIALASSASASPSRSSGPAPSPNPPPPGPAPSPAPAAWKPGTPCAMSSNVPADIQAEVQKALNDDKSPADYEALAKSCDAAGYSDAAACLRAKEQIVLQEIQVRGGMPFIIRQGDIPFDLAKYYTGNGLRFEELAPLNPNIGALVLVGGVSNYQRWIPGTEILIPKSWNPAALPLPFPEGTPV